MGGLFDSDRTNTTDDQYIAVDNPSNLDAFSRIRVSEPRTKFEYAFLYDDNSILFNSSLVSGGLVTHNTTTKTLTLTCTTTTNSESIYQSREYIRYPIGKSILVFLAGNFNGQATSVTKRYGQFDANNGYFVELDGTNAKVVLRSKTSGSVVDNAINQTSWNLDKLNGTGISGLTLDFTKVQTICISYQWGSGRVLFGFMIAGSIVWCHQFLAANINTIAYSQTANLPVRASIKNNASTTSTMLMISGAVICDGGDTDFGRLYSINNASTARNFTGAGGRIPIISLRKQTTVPEMVAEVIDYGCYFNSADDFLIEIVKNPTLTGASWANTTSGYMQRDVAATALSGGTTMISFYGTGGASGGLLTPASSATSSTQTLNYRIGTLLDGSSEIISLVLTNITATASAYGFINYKELL